MCMDQEGRPEGVDKNSQLLDHWFPEKVAHAKKNRAYSASEASWIRIVVIFHGMHVEELACVVVAISMLL